MSIDFWLLAFVFWGYFHLMGVQPDGASERGLVKLPRKFLFPGDVLRTSVCLAPFVALKNGLDPGNNLFMCSLSLSTAIAPLMLFSPEPGSEDVGSILLFSLKWALSEFDRFVKTAIFMLPFTLLSLLPVFDVKAQTAWLARHFSLTPRVDKCLELPIGFYIACTLVLLVRSMMLLGVSRRSGLFLTCGWVSGVTVLMYFYNLTGLIPLTVDNWEAPVGGVLAAWLLKLYVSWSWARIDAAHEQHA